MPSVTYTRLGTNGRFANQLSQIAATLAFVFDAGRDFVFPEWPYSKYMEKELPVGNLENPTLYREPHFHYAEIPKDLQGDIDLFGHFQSPLYFAHQWENIKPYLTLKPAHKEKVTSIFLNMFMEQEIPLPKKTCSIHVRRTDYTSPINLEFHGVMPVEYYLEGIKKLYGVTNPKDVLFVFYSDDIPWCKRNFSLPNMYFSEGNDEVTDLYFMSMCDDNIIANSSYSWWGAWLNENPDKKVVSPKNWFGPKCPHDSKDVHDKSWIVI